MNCLPDECTLTWLSSWYRQQCDGDWEHEGGVRVTTLDNPGWALDVDLANTKWVNCAVPPRLSERNEQDWVFVEVKDGLCRGRGGPENLTEMIALFRGFIEENQDGI